MVQPLVSFWMGAALGPVERACMISALRHGHEFVLYCYEAPANVPDGVRVRDAREILPEHRVIRHHSGSVALFSNHFRYELQRRGLGTWIDCDVYLLKPIDLDRPALFAWEAPGLINTAILRLPRQSPILADLLEIFDERKVPPWIPARARLASTYRRLRTGRTGVAQMPWGSAGPKAFSWLAHRHGITAEALPSRSFYPVPWQQAARIADEPLRELVHRDSVAIHLWNECIKSSKNRPGSPGSFLEQLQREGAACAAAGAPQVSVVMPVRNARPYLDQSVESILGQSFTDFELVIVDDASVDGSRERLRAWAAIDPRIRLIESAEPLGPVGSSNLAVAQTRAPLVARMDADDVALPCRLERQIEALAAEPSAVAVGGLADVIDAEGRTLLGVDPERLTRRGLVPPVPHSTLLFRRCAFEAVGGYSEKASLWEDVDLVVRLAGEGRILVLPERLTRIRRSQASTRLVAGGDRLEQAMDLMIRTLSGEPERPSERRRLESFVLAGSVRLWAGERPLVLGRIARFAQLNWNWNSAATLIWAAWADLSPRTLRSILRIWLACRTRLWRRRYPQCSPYEWRPRFSKDFAP